MLNKEINLASGAAQQEIALQRTKRQVKKLAILILFGFVLIALVVLVGFLWFDHQLKANEAKISLLKNEINKYSKIESYLTVISSRTEQVSSLLVKRASYSQAINNVKLILIPGFAPERLEIAPEGGLKVGGSCRDNQTLNLFYANVKTLADEGNYKTVSYTDVSRDSKGGYRLNLELKK